MWTYWFNILYLLITWGVALYGHMRSEMIEPIPLLLSALFFTLYFMLPLMRDRVYMSILYLLTILVCLTFWTSFTDNLAILILLLLAKHALEYASGKALYIFLVTQICLILSFYLWKGDYLAGSYTVLLLVYISFLFVSWYHAFIRLKKLESEYDETNSSYRKLKRRVVDQEQWIRQEERNQIAREIHDSIGHRLTALLMQLEVARIQATNQVLQGKFNHLKTLAQMSLDDTREAVKTLKSEESTGLAAVIQLIRRLESESHLRVAFIVNPGALSVTLTNRQSVTVYRSIQEALTNMMRHSQVRQAQAEFSLVGEHFFRFSVSHNLKEKVQVNEGFGLTAMRDRLEQLQGNLKITQVEQTFKISGTFPLERRISDGIDFVSGRSDVGSTRLEDDD